MPTNQTGNHEPGSGADYARRMRMERAKQTAREKPSMGAMIAKIVVGIALIVIGLLVRPSGSISVPMIIICAVIGVIFIALGVLGYKRQQREIEDAQLHVVLNTPPEEDVHSEIHDLAAKYDEQPSGNTMENTK